MPQVDSVDLDFDSIKTAKRIYPENRAVAFLKNLALLLVFTLVIFGTINFPAFYRIYQYKLYPQNFADSASLYACPGVKTNVLYPENSLTISRIGVKANVKWDVASGDIMGVLESDLAHVAGTGKPGEGKNVFITGHSSNYWWNEGSLNTVFALLPELKEKDEIYLAYKGKVHRYEVKEKVELNKGDVASYVSSDKEQLTLMTCVPVGTNLRRLLVIAKPV